MPFNLSVVIDRCVANMMNQIGRFLKVGQRVVLRLTIICCVVLGCWLFAILAKDLKIAVGISDKMKSFRESNNS